MHSRILPSAPTAMRSSQSRVALFGLFCRRSCADSRAMLGYINPRDKHAARPRRKPSRDKVGPPHGGAVRACGPFKSVPDVARALVQGKALAIACGCE